MFSRFGLLRTHIVNSTQFDRAAVQQYPLSKKREPGKPASGHLHILFEKRRAWLHSITLRHYSSLPLFHAPHSEEQLENCFTGSTSRVEKESGLPAEAPMLRHPVTSSHHVVLAQRPRGPTTCIVCPLPCFPRSAQTRRHRFANENKLIKKFTKK